MDMFLRNNTLHNAWHGPISMFKQDPHRKFQSVEDDLNLCRVVHCQMTVSSAFFLPRGSSLFGASNKLQLYLQNKFQSPFPTCKNRRCTVCITFSYKMRAKKDMHRVYDLLTKIQIRPFQQQRPKLIQLGQQVSKMLGR